MSDSLLINGHQHSWASVKIKIDGEEFTGLTSIKYADALESVLAYGMGRGHRPRGRSVGKYTIEPLVVTLWKSSAQALRAQLAKSSANGKSYGTVIFQVVLQFIEQGDTPITIEFQDCKWGKNSATDEEGTDPLKEEVEWQPTGILRNGLALYDVGA